ncbi:MAG: hypothetical protein KDK27_07385, partial [Leptospiraceae bacterium]|nr:hypothetical protein [Leptospiraceae bacterium]
MININSSIRYIQSIGFYSVLISFLLTGCHVDRSLDVQDRNTYQNCTHDDFFQSNLCDYELEHFQWAAAYPEFRNLDDLNRSAMQKIMRDAGDVDRAAALFAHRVITEPRNRKLLEYLNTRESEIAEHTPDFSDLNILFAVVPG